MRRAAAPATHLVLAFEHTSVPLALTGLELSGGALVLAPLPAPAAPAQAPVAPSLAGPAAIAADRAGRVYLSDPGADRVLVLGPCEETPVPLPCLSSGEDPGQLREPGGLAVDPHGMLYVSERGNHRVQAIDPETGRVRRVIGQSDPYAPPRPSAEPGRLRAPTDVASDGAGRLYVADRGNGRVQRFGAGGEVDAAFAATLAAQDEVPQDPTHVAIAVLDSVELLVVLDTRPGGAALLVYGLDGTLDTGRTAALADALRASGGAGPGGLTAGDGRLFVGDPAGRVLAFDAGGRLLGPVPGFRGPVAGLALDAQGRLVVHSGTEQGVLRLAAESRVESGTFVLGPLSVEGVTRWQRVRVLADPLPRDAHLRLLTFTGDDPAAAPPPLEEWGAASTDQLDALVLAGEGPYLWIAGVLTGNGGATPALRAVRVDWDHEGCMRWLPATYSRDVGRREVLERLVALLESGLDEQQDRIARLPELFDSGGAPDGGVPGRWLDWLAGWLGLELDERWSPAQRRAAVRWAFATHGRRGTARGLREAVRFALGLDVTIREPAASAELWTLGGQRSMLGFGTGLAAAEPEGAVLDVTATLGRAHLLEAGAVGAPLFADLAHRFCVTVHAADLPTAGAREGLVRLVEREKPAHTAWTLCVVEPRARVGLQARLGVDAVVARSAEPLRLGGDAPLGDAALARTGPKAGLGAGVRLGVDATVS